MRKNSSPKWSNFDWLTTLLTVILVTIGWAMIFAAEHQADSEDLLPSLFDMSKDYGKQLLFIGISLALGFIAQLINFKFYRRIAPVFYVLILALLVAVLGTKPIKGATSWFSLGGFKFQPSEIAKVATCLALASFLNLPKNKLKTLKAKLKALSIVLLPMGLVLLQGDAGSTIVFVSFLFVLLRAGMDLWIYIVGAIVVLLSILTLVVDSPAPLFFMLTVVGNISLLYFGKQRKRQQFLSLYLLFVLLSYGLLPADYEHMMILHGFLLVTLGLFYFRKKWRLSTLAVGGVFLSGIYILSVNYLFHNVLKNYQQERILVWLQPEKCDPLGALYNVNQSKYAIGSGTWFGKGFLNGERTKLDYVPEQSTDFIFCTIGEEWGFLGTTLTLLLFLALLLRIIYIAERQRALFSRYYAYGVASILFFHVFVNVGMTVGLVPVTGIPLPFFSYGGSSLLSFILLVALLLKFDYCRLLVFR